MKNLFVLLVLLVASMATFNLTLLNAQVVPDNSPPYNNPAYLIETFLGDGNCSFQNLTYTGSPNAIAHFTNSGGAGVGITEGIVLSTGEISEVAGPNDNSFTSSSFFSPGDADLDALLFNPSNPIQLTTNDAAVIEFDFIPIENSISFNFVFASEEYPEFVCGNFSDAIGFFLSGPGIVGSVNLAVVPGTTTPVNISSINSGMAGSSFDVSNCAALDNDALYVDNASGAAVELDGFTTVLTATSGVVPCETYHLKIAIADAGDTSIDSALFLEANSFNAGTSSSNFSLVNLSAVNPQVGETCGEGQFLFERVSTDTTEPLTVSFMVGGTATYAVDYEAFATSITIPAGEASTTLVVTPIADTSTEGNETISLSLADAFCICTAPPSSSLILTDDCEAGINLKAKVLLEGAMTLSGEMNSNLLNNNLLPLNQPYNIAPWNYSGNESVADLNNVNALVSDWVLVELMTANSNSTVVEQKAAFVLKDGTIVEANGSGEYITLFEAINLEEYYLVIRHRNHLDVVSSQSIRIQNGEMVFDFTAGISQAQGNDQMVLVGSKATMHQGDVDGNGVVSYQDFNQYLNQFGSNSTYTTADFNFDGMVSIADFNDYFANSALIGVDLIRY